jgi:hypothetical protein
VQRLQLAAAAVENKTPGQASQVALPVTEKVPGVQALQSP